MESKPARLDSLTGLRYWAALTVVFAHVASDNDQLDYDLLRGLSTIGMPLFFTLSGFLLCYNYYADFAKGRWGTLRRFYVSRFARIYPAYLLALLLSFSFMGNFFHDLRDRTFETLRCLAFDFTLTQSWVHRPAFVDYLHPRTVSQAYLGIAWSVSTEMFFYATFPLLIPVLKRFTRPSAILAAAGAIWFGYALFDLWYFRGGDDFWSRVGKYSEARWLLNYSPYGRWGEFAIGCLIGRLFGLAAERPIGGAERFCGSLVTWACLPALVWASSFVGYHHYADRLHLNVGLAPLCVLLIYGLARYRSGLTRLLARPMFVRLGESSYCLFLLHPMIQSFYLPRTRGEDEYAEWHVLSWNHLMMLVVLHLVAFGCHQVVEVPLREWFSKWLSPRAAGRNPAEIAPVGIRRIQRRRTARGPEISRNP